MHRIVSVRTKSTLAEKLRAATSSAILGDSKKKDVGSFSVKDESGEDFRELFVMPKRKLRGQMQLEQATGRAEVKQRSRIDLNDRLAERRPRSEEMNPEQDWSNVWPAAKTFSASVVPLPVRMGSRPNIEKRAPFKKEGNLELVKIPNFLHLTPSAIEKHCNAIKKFCTPYPPEILDNKVLESQLFPINISYNSYVHQGTNIRDNRSRVVTMTVNIDVFGLNDVAKSKLLRLVGDRFDENNNTLTIITDRCHTRKQNLDYAYYLLTVLYHEANKVEDWEALQERVDNLKVEFDGSPAKEKLIDLISKSRNCEKLKCPVNSEDPQKDANFKEFVDTWTDYRNKEETIESTRTYSRKIKQLLGLQSPTQPPTKQA
ncbi:unnamed protein product [Caenorhabditis bovis]|uniref:Small ribosomal subunit protein mS35 mitochondrial conserved domain-containing protein n=1 Tax=Caenorhabditis bovis TaxID=2654633 RepID=A0A8S1DZ22_9PELO|nr:unnamed protein product [Caenorhabditis bovis]